MASGTRSIVWRSDIDAGRERPAFFCAAKRGRADPAGGTAGGTVRDPANPANPSFSGKEGREEEEERRGDERGELERGGGVICLTNKSK